MNIDERVALMKEYRKKGYNCAQAVLVVYKDLLEEDEETLVKAAYGFGGGVGGTGNLCGCLTGAVMALSFKYGKQEHDPRLKMELHQKVQGIIQDFHKEFKDTQCSNLKEYRLMATNPKYKICDGYIEDTIRLLESYMNNQNG